MDGSNRYGVLTVTVAAVLVVGIAAILTRNSWTDNNDRSKAAGLLTTGSSTTEPPTSLYSPPTFVSTTFPVPMPTVPVVPSLPLAPKAAPPSAKAPAAPKLPPLPASTAPPTSTTKPGPPSPPPSTTPATPVVEQRSQDEMSFNYGPSPADRTNAASRPTGEQGVLGFVVGAILNADTWDLTADVTDLSGKVVRFDGGIDVLIALTCNGHPESFHLQNPAITSLQPQQGVRLRYGPIRPSDPGPGTCVGTGSVRYSTA